MKLFLFFNPSHIFSFQKRNFNFPIQNWKLSNMTVMAFPVVEFSSQGLELVSKELNHLEVIADLFRQIGGHSSRFVLICSFWSSQYVYYSRNSIELLWFYLIVPYCYKVSFSEPMQMTKDRTYQKHNAVSKLSLYIQKEM